MTGRNQLTLPRRFMTRSEDVDAGGIGGARRASSTSRSLPTSPSVRKRLSDSYGLESVLKNLEELAQQHTNQLQWPTWVRRRGWFASNQAGTGQPSAAEVAAPPSAAVVDDGSGRMVQVDKDKWVFQRHRKKAGPPTLFSPVVIKREGVCEGSLRIQLGKLV